MKKEVGSGVGSGSISQRYGSWDPDPHQNVTDPQHCLNPGWVQVTLGVLSGRTHSVYTGVKLIYLHAGQQSTSKFSQVTEVCTIQQFIVHCTYNLLCATNTSITEVVHTILIKQPSINDETFVFSMQCCWSALISVRIQNRHFRSVRTRIRIQGIDDWKLQNFTAEINPVVYI